MILGDSLVGQEPTTAPGYGLPQIPGKGINIQKTERKL